MIFLWHYCCLYIPSAIRTKSELRINMKQIVIIDDQYTTRLILSQIMQQIELKEQLHIEMFECPLAALDWVIKNDTHLILVDYSMKLMNGQEFLKNLKGNKKFEKIPIIGMSIDNDISLKYQFLEDGAADFFLKPFDYHECMLRCKYHLTH